MPSKRRLALPVVGAGVLGALSLMLLLQSHANATSRMNYGRLNKIQKRIVSESLASALGPAPSRNMPTVDQGGGPDGAPFTRPKSYGSPGGSGGSLDNYFPASSGNCSSRLDDNVKVNQNC